MTETSASTALRPVVPAASLRCRRRLCVAAAHRVTAAGNNCVSQRPEMNLKTSHTDATDATAADESGDDNGCMLVCAPACCTVT